MTALDEFQRQRGRLFGIAYRMLGSAAEAEDVLQDAWLRWQGLDHDEVRDPAALLATIVTRLSLTTLDSARVRRESYLGPWLPEPVATDADPALGAERAEALETAVLLLLERLTPAERAAYVLHEAFDYPYRQVAEVLEVSEANARQLGSRAAAHLTRERARPSSAAERSRLLAAFLDAAQRGDLAALEAVLLDDVMALSDGGGIVTAARKPVVGRERVAEFLLRVLEKWGAGLEATVIHVNGEPAILSRRGAEPIAIVTFEFGEGGIRKVLNVMNPEKLVSFAR